jgi:glycosyltransferase involved in cell wall biosynthesis
MMRAMADRDLFVTVYTPVPGSGGAMRVQMLLRALAATSPAVHVVYVRFGGDAPAPALQAIPNLTFEAVEPSRGARRAWTYAALRAARWPDGWARAVSPELVAASARHARDPQTRRVIADGPGAAAGLARLARRRPMIYNAQNLESSYRHELDGETGSADTLRSAERRLLGRFAESWMVSEADVAGARELCPNAKVRLVPNVVDVASIVAVAPRPEAQRILMTADYTYEPNRNGVRFLLDAVMPRVWEQAPDATLRLVGRGLEDPAPDEPRVQVAGFVDDLADEYAAASVAVVPLLQGGGTPLKFVEGLARGLPIVATPRAAAGLAVRDGEHYLEGADGAAFAGAILQLIGPSPAADGVALAARARAVAQERYSLAALERTVAA